METRKPQWIESYFDKDKAPSVTELTDLTKENSDIELKVSEVDEGYFVIEENAELAFVNEPEALPPEQPVLTRETPSTQPITILPSPKTRLADEIKITSSESDEQTESLISTTLPSEPVHEERVQTTFSDSESLSLLSVSRAGSKIYSRGPDEKKENVKIDVIHPVETIKKTKPSCFNEFGKSFGLCCQTLLSRICCCFPRPKLKV